MTCFFASCANRKEVVIERGPCGCRRVYYRRCNVVRCFLLSISKLTKCLGKNWYLCWKFIVLILHVKRISFIATGHVLMYGVSNTLFVAWFLSRFSFVKWLIVINNEIYYVIKTELVLCLTYT